MESKLPSSIKNNKKKRKAFDWENLTIRCIFLDNGCIIQFKSNFIRGHPMEILQENENGITQIIIKGRLDAETAPEADRLIKDTVGQEKIRLLFDLCDLEYISSAGLRLILQTAKAVWEKGGQIVLCCSNEMVREVLTSSRLLIANSVAAGIKKFS
jgi:anti-anti-sigma factor